MLEDKWLQNIAASFYYCMYLTHAHIQINILINSFHLFILVRIKVRTILIISQVKCNDRAVILAMLFL